MFQGYANAPHNTYAGHDQMWRQHNIAAYMGGGQPLNDSTYAPSPYAINTSVNDPMYGWTVPMPNPDVNSRRRIARRQLAHSARRVSYEDEQPGPSRLQEAGSSRYQDSDESITAEEEGA